MLWKWPATAITTPVLTSSILSVHPSSQTCTLQRSPFWAKFRVDRLHSKLHCTKLQPRWHPCNTFSMAIRSMRSLVLILCFAGLERALTTSSCPSGWNQLSNGKCVTVPVNADGTGYGFQPSCVETCQAAAPAGQTSALTCVKSASEHQAIVDWMNSEDTIYTITARRSTRYFFWIGNYQPINTECCGSDSRLRSGIMAAPRKAPLLLQHVQRDVQATLSTVFKGG